MSDGAGDDGLVGVGPGQELQDGEGVGEGRLGGEGTATVRSSSTLGRSGSDSMASSVKCLQTMRSRAGGACSRKSSVRMRQWRPPSPPLVPLGREEEWRERNGKRHELLQLRWEKTSMGRR